MPRMSRTFSRYAALLFAVLSAACRQAAPVTVPAPVPAAEASEARHLPHEIRWVRDSAEYQASVIQTYRFAGEVLQALAADLEPGTWAVALDADETVISNLRYQEERAAIGEAYEPESWAEWVGRREAPPLPGAMAFLSQIRELGGKIAIVTNRRHAQCPDTEANFHAFSIPFDVILCQRDDGRKEARWRQIQDGTASRDLPPLEIVMWLGDNIQDFPDLSQDLRDRPEVAFERFGLEFFVFPNPMYGSWDD